MLNRHYAMIDTSTIKTCEELHDTLAERLDFPAYYGRNLAALADMLSQTTQPTEILVLSRSEVPDPNSYLSKFAFVCMRESLANCYVNFSITHGLADFDIDDD